MLRILTVARVVIGGRLRCLSAVDAERTSKLLGRGRWLGATNGELPVFQTVDFAVAVGVLRFFERSRMTLFRSGMDGNGEVVSPLCCVLPRN